MMLKKYARNKNMANIIRHAIAQAPFESGARIKFQGFGNSNYKSREMDKALGTLEKSMLLKLIYPTTNTKIYLQSHTIWLES